MGILTQLQIIPLLFYSQIFWIVSSPGRLRDSKGHQPQLFKHLLLVTAVLSVPFQRRKINGSLKFHGGTDGVRLPVFVFPVSKNLLLFFREDMASWSGLLH